MANAVEKVAEEIVSLVEPLALEAAVLVLEVIRRIANGPDGAELHARRTLQALEAQAEIRS